MPTFFCYLISYEVGTEDGRFYEGGLPVQDDPVDDACLFSGSNKWIIDSI